MHNSSMMRPITDAAEPDRLQAAVSELSRHEAEPTVFSNQLSVLVANLAQSGAKLPADALEPLYPVFERHVAAPSSAGRTTSVSAHHSAAPAGDIAPTRRGTTVME